MKQAHQKEIELVVDNSLKHARSQYSWVIGASKALKKERRRDRAANASLLENTRVENTGVEDTRVESTEVLSAKVCTLSAPPGNPQED